MTSILDERLIHVISDPQEREMSRFCDVENKTKFGPKLRQFSDELRNVYSIPTLVLAWGINLGFHDNLAAREVAIEKLGLRNVGVRPDEVLFEKGENPNAFLSPLLANYLRRHSYSGIIHTGMHVPLCVESTIKGALGSGFTCYAIIDLMADCTVDKLFEFNSANHQRILEYILEEPDYSGKSLSFHRQQDFLALLKEKPAPPAKATPALKLQQLTA